MRKPQSLILFFLTISVTALVLIMMLLTIFGRMLPKDLRYKSENPANYCNWLILSFPRSGTTWLMSILLSHPWAYQGENSSSVEKEIFNREHWRATKSFSAVDVSDDEFITSRIRSFYNVTLPQGKQCIGYKHLWDHLPLHGHAAALRELRARNVSVILQVRNPIAQGLSLFEARMLHHRWHMRGNRTMHPRLSRAHEVNISFLLTNIAEADHFLYVAPQLLEQLGIRWTYQAYEKLVAEPEAQSRRILEFLSLPPSERLRFDTQKQIHVLPPQERVSNWHELEDALANDPVGTKYLDSFRLWIKR